MKLRSIGLAFFVLISIAGYLLNRGVYVGSSIDYDSGEHATDPYGPAYRKACKYLYLNGTRVEAGPWARSLEQADFSCSLIHQ
jgi:hypothetical protein